MTPHTSRAYSLDYEHHKGLLHQFARKGYGRMQQLNINIEYEDVYQELCATFVHATHMFNPDAGVSFTAYLGRSLWNQFNRFLESEQREKYEISPVSIDDFATDDEGDERDIYSTFQCEGTMSPEEALSFKQEVAQRNRSVKGSVAKMFIRQLINPSPEVREMQRQKGAKDIGIGTIAEAHGINRYQATKAKDELNKVYGLNLRLR